MSTKTDIPVSTHWSTLAEQAADLLDRAAGKNSLLDGSMTTHGAPNVARRLEQIAEDVREVLLSPFTAERR